MCDGFLPHVPPHSEVLATQNDMNENVPYNLRPPIAREATSNTRPAGRASLESLEKIAANKQTSHTAMAVAISAQATRRRAYIHSILLVSMAIQES